MKRRNCNLQLRLVPPSISHFPDDNNHHQQPMMALMEGISEPAVQNQQLTIFYNGGVSSCDVTELQARAIILHASQRVEERSKSQGQGSDDPPAIASPLLLMTSQLMGSHCPPSPAGISMKRSLQRFLQRRMLRIQSTSPYQHQHHH